MSQRDETVQLIATETHVTVFVFHGRLKGLSLLPWFRGLSFVVIAHLTDMTSPHPHLSQASSPFDPNMDRCHCLRIMVCLLHILILNQFVSQV